MQQHLPLCKEVAFLAQQELPQGGCGLNTDVFEPHIARKVECEDVEFLIAV